MPLFKIRINKQWGFVYKTLSLYDTDSLGSRERIVMFGAVNPADGEVYYSTYEAENSENFMDYLK